MQASAAMIATTVNSSMGVSQICKIQGAHVDIPKDPLNKMEAI